MLRAHSYCFLAADRIQPSWEVTFSSFLLVYLRRLPKQCSEGQGSISSNTKSAWLKVSCRTQSYGALWTQRLKRPLRSSSGAQRLLEPHPVILGGLWAFTGYSRDHVVLGSESMLGTMQYMHSNSCITSPHLSSLINKISWAHSLSSPGILFCQNRQHNGETLDGSQDRLFSFYEKLNFTSAQVPQLMEH